MEDREERSKGIEIRKAELSNRLVVVYYESIINRLEEFFVVYYYESRKRERRFNIDKVRAVDRTYE